MKKLINRWEQITFYAVKKKKFSKLSAEELIEDTQRHLSDFSESDVVPKEALTLLLKMQEFFIETSKLSDGETPIEFCDYQKMYSLVSTLKNNFFS